MKKVVCLLIAAAFCGPCVAQTGDNTKTVTITITGTIKNFDEFKAVVRPDTYIQLVPISANESFVASYHCGETCDVLLVFYYSDLLKLSVPKNAAFSFTVPNVPPGRYVIAAQNLPSSGLPGERHFFLAFLNAEQQDALNIEIMADAKSPITLNVGNVIVNIH